MLQFANATESPPQYVPMSLLRQMVLDPSTRTQLDLDPVEAFAAHGIEIQAPAHAELGKALASYIGDGGTAPPDMVWVGLFG